MYKHIFKRIRGVFRHARNDRKTVLSVPITGATNLSTGVGGGAGEGAGRVNIS